MKRDEWRAIPGWDGLYEISTAGHIRNVARRRGTTPFKLMKPRMTKDGYAKIVLTRNSVHSGFFIHRLVHITFIGEIPFGHEVDHLDGNKQNNSLGNIEAVTKQENMRRSFESGRKSARGEGHGRAAFTEAQVLQIKSRLSLGERQNAIACEYGVTPTAINCIATGRTWSHVRSPHPCR